MKEQNNGYKDFKTEMDMSPKGFGLPKKLWRQLLKYRNKTVDKCASDEMFGKMPFQSLGASDQKEILMRASLLDCLDVKD